MEIITEKTVFGGKSIAKINGKTVFVPFSLPGERLDIRITEEKRDYDNAVIQNILSPSPYRVTPECPYYGQCGGCNLMHAQSGFQTELRLKMLDECFLHNGIDTAGKTECITGPAFGYRSRFQLNDGGLSRRDSNLVIPVTGCLCAEAPINEYLRQTPPEQRERGRSHLFASSFDASDTPGITVFSETTVDKNRHADKNSSKICRKENRFFPGTVYSPENAVTVRLNQKLISFDVRGFFQSNLFVFEKFLALLKELLPGGNTVLDVYAGCGAISVFLADLYENVLLVEHNRDAVVYAEQNLRGKKHTSYALSGAKWAQTCASSCGKVDACVLDPPRSGIEKEVTDCICREQIPLVISLSCDPATHARDCARFLRSGYTLERLLLLDFYPNTSHIESLAVLKAGGGR